MQICITLEDELSTRKSCVLLKIRALRIQPVFPCAFQIVSSFQFLNFFGLSTRPGPYGTLKGDITRSADYFPEPRTNIVEVSHLGPADIDFLEPPVRIEVPWSGLQRGACLTPCKSSSVAISIAPPLGTRLKENFGSCRTRNQTFILLLRDISMCVY